MVVKTRTLAAVAAALALLAVPSAAAKFRMSLSLSAEIPAVDQPVELTLETDTKLPPDHRLRLVAVAPGVEMYSAIRSALRAPETPSELGFHTWLIRTGPLTWGATVRFTRPGRWLLVIPNWGHIGYALPPPVRQPVRVGPCPVTVANGRKPGNHGNGALFTGLWPNGTVLATPEHVRPDGSIEMKFPWWRGNGVRGALKISGRRLDGRAPPLKAHIPLGYGPTGFQATGLIFATEGCWQVTGRAGKGRLTFVTRVVRVPA
jgi:hypothetical protein